MTRRDFKSRHHLVVTRRSVILIREINCNAQLILNEVKRQNNVFHDKLPRLYAILITILLQNPTSSSRYRSWFRSYFRVYLKITAHY